MKTLAGFFTLAQLLVYTSAQNNAGFQLVGCSDTQQPRPTIDVIQSCYDQARKAANTFFYLQEGSICRMGMFISLLIKSKS